MRFAVFLRAANVGGRTFSTRKIAEALADLGVKNLGTAGTFLVEEAQSAKAVRDAFETLVPPECDVLVRPLDEIVALVARAPFSGETGRGTLHVTILARNPEQTPPLPFEVPAEGPWQLRVLDLEGVYVLSLRDAEPGKFYPNEILERRMGVRATTRTWKTLVDLVTKAAT